MRLVGLTDPIDPAHAPSPSNDSERLVFRQLYETLVRVDCDGHVRPGLAASWHLDADGRTWIVTLGEHASFTDAASVTSADVIASWSGDAGAGLRLRARRLVQTVTVIDDRSLAVVLRSPRTDAPASLAHADLAVARTITGSPWPLGTRSTVVFEDRVPGSLSGSKRLTIVQAGSGPVAPSRDPAPLVTFLIAPDRDPRDLLDAGMDLMVTREPAALDYAATLPQYQRLPMAWGRTRVFVRRGKTAAPLTPEQRQMLAADAVRGEARGAEEPFWWETLQGCEPAPPRFPVPPSRSSTGRIVYDGNDDAARDLADRLVALAGAPGVTTAPLLEALLPDAGSPRVQRAVGLTGDPLAVARRRGNDEGYVMRFDRAPLDPCAELQRAVEDVEWLRPDQVVPLVDTRLQAILRRERAHVTVEGDGGLLLTGEDVGR